MALLGPFAIAVSRLLRRRTVGVIRDCEKRLRPIVLHPRNTRMSDKPVVERLQVKGERRLAVVGASAAVDNKIGVKKRRSDMSEADVIILFAGDRSHLVSTLPSILKEAPNDAIIWIASPKLSSKLTGDLSRDTIHALSAEFGLDTVSQIAIDDDWSAMRVKRIR
jgi:hypothetical protein